MSDTQAAHDLKLYIDNDGALYRSQTTSILKSLVTKRARGEYRHDLAVKAFGYLVESGAKKYAKDFGSDQPWHKMFDVGTRKRTAEELTRDFEGEAALGNYDGPLPKKYQKSLKTTGGHATKRSLTGRAASRQQTVAARDLREFRDFLRNATDRQVQEIFAKESQAGRNEYADLALEESERRSLGGGHATIRRGSVFSKSPAQLQREINRALSSYRGR